MFDRLLALLPEKTGIESKKEYDFFLKKRLFAVLETIRQERVAEIQKSRKAEKQKREAEAEQARIAEKKRRKFIKYSAIIAPIAVVMMIVISLLSSHFSTISKIDDYISAQQYEHAFDAVNCSNLSAEKKQEYRDMLTPLMQNQVTKGLERYQIITADNYGIFLKDNEIIVRDENGDDLLHYNGRGKILEDIIYANGYVLFVEAFDSWGLSEEEFRVLHNFMIRFYKIMKTWHPVDGDDLERFIFLYWDWFNPDNDESVYGFDYEPLQEFSYDAVVRNSKLAKDIAEILKGDYPYGAPDFSPYTIAKDLTEGCTGISAQFDEVWAMVYMMQSLGMIVVKDILDDEHGQVYYSICVSI